MKTDSKFRLWNCCSCNGEFATVGIEETEQCPYCSSVVLVADEERYSLTESRPEADENV